MPLKVAKRSPIFLRALEDWIESWDKLKRSKIHTFYTTIHALRHTLRCHASLTEDLLQEGFDFVTTTKFQSDSYMSGGCFPVSHRNIVCVVRKKTLKLKISNLSSMILSRPTIVLDKKQMIFSIGWNKLLIFTPFNFTPNLEMHQTTSLDMLLSRQSNIAKTAASTV